MTRGYLWENLESEIADEFASLARVDTSYVFDFDRFFVGSLSTPQSYWRQIWIAEDKRLPSDLLARLKARRQEVVIARRHELATGMTKKERARLIRARRAAEDKCVQCERKRVPGGSRCEVHREEHNAYYRAKRKEKRGMKERLETDREGTRLAPGITHHFVIIAKCDRKSCKISPSPECDQCGGSGVYDVKGYIIANPYMDGRLGEIFINIGKTSSSEAWIDQWARAASFALQYGAPVDELFGKFVATRFEPSGATRNKVIRRCSSILDYVSRYILLRFGSKEAAARIAGAEVSASTESVQP